MNSEQSMVTLLLVMATLVPWIQCLIQLEQQDHNYTLSNKFIEKINSMQSSWKAGRNFDPNEITEETIQSLCGVQYNSKMTKLFKARSRAMFADEPLFSDVTIPTKFDARNAWPNCTSIGLIRDQGSCGSCWAVSVTSAISDRICIASGEKLNVQISAEDLMSCCKYCGKGCKGGDPYSAWFYYSKTGVSSGGEYNSKVGCKPYSIPNNNRKETEIKSYPSCSKVRPPTPKCMRQCTNPLYLKPYEQDKFYGNGLPRSLETVEQIQLDIMKYGSVTAVFKVYKDFLYYKSGVYVHTTGIQVSRHAVRVIGWGEENDTSYWLVANSWNENWGDKGIVKFRRGTNECSIESDVIGGMPKL